MDTIRALAGRYVLSILRHASIIGITHAKPFPTLEKFNGPDCIWHRDYLFVTELVR